MNTYKVTLLRGDGIGPEIVAEAVKVLDAAGKKYGFAVEYTDALMGGCAIDATGVPLPQETIDKCLAADAVLLGAVGGWKWDTLPGNLRPEAGLLGIRGRWGCSPTCARPRSTARLRAPAPCAPTSSGTAWTSWWCGS